MTPEERRRVAQLERDRIAAWLRDQGSKRLARYPFDIAEALERDAHITGEGWEGSRAR